MLQARTEVSYGLTDSLHASGYLNLSYANVFHNTPDHETAPPEIFADYSVDPDKRMNRGRFEGVSRNSLACCASADEEASGRRAGPRGDAPPASPFRFMRPLATAKICGTP